VLLFFYRVHYHFRKPERNGQQQISTFFERNWPSTSPCLASVLVIITYKSGFQPQNTSRLVVNNPKTALYAAVPYNYTLKTPSEIRKVSQKSRREFHEFSRIFQPAKMDRDGKSDDFRAQNWRNSMGINGLKFALTPALSLLKC